MIEKGPDGAFLVPIKVYEVDSKIASRYKGATCEEVETAAGVPVIQEVVIQTNESRISEWTQTEHPQPDLKGVTSKSSSSKTHNTPNTEEESTTKSHCSKPLRDLIEELGTFISDEDTPNNENTGMEDKSKAEQCNKVEVSTVVTAESTQSYVIEAPTPKKVFEFDELTGKYRCSGCDKLFKTKSHKKVACSKSKTVDTDLCFDAETQTYKCDVCDKSFTSKTSFVNHKRNICNKAPQHECIFCDFKGRSPIVVRVHCGKKHGKWPRLLRNGVWVYE